MSEGLNKVYLLGRLGGDPELRMTQGGTAVLNIRLATNERYIDKNGDRRETTYWHRAVLWGRRAEALAKFLQKGTKVMIEGQLRTRSWDDKDGTKRYMTEVNVQDIFLLSGRGADDSTVGPADSPSPTEFNFGEDRRATSTGTTAFGKASTDTTAFEKAA